MIRNSLKNTVTDTGINLKTSSLENKTQFEKSCIQSENITRARVGVWSPLISSSRARGGDSAEVSDCSQMGQIRDFFRSTSQNVLKSNLKRSLICPICGQSDPLWSQTYHPWLYYIEIRNVRISPKWVKS